MNHYTDDSRPDIRELCKKVTPNFALHWWRIGIFLNIRPSELGTIEYEYRNCQERCDRMLVKWLEVDITASWKKLKHSIKLALEDRTAAGT